MLKGSEKQIKWAEDIVADIVRTAQESIEWAKQIPAKNEKMQANKERLLKVLEDTIENVPQIESAAVIIDEFQTFKPAYNKGFDTHKDNMQHLMWHLQHSSLKAQISDRL